MHIPQISKSLLLFSVIWFVSVRVIGTLIASSVHPVFLLLLILAWPFIGIGLVNAHYKNHPPASLKEKAAIVISWIISVAVGFVVLSL